MESDWQSIRVLIENITSVDEEDLEEKPQDISQERWERIARIRPLDDKKRSLLAGRLLYRMCQECGLKEPEYGTVKSGKPILINHPEIVFSISHSGEYVVVAYAKNITSIGVDIQQMKCISDGVKKRLLHEKEHMWMKKMLVDCEKEAEGNLHKEVWDETLYLNRIWAIKESFVKMTGEGLSHDLRKLYVDMVEKMVTDENGYRVSFMAPEAPEGYVLAVVMEE